MKRQLILGVVFVFVLVSCSGNKEKGEPDGKNEKTTEVQDDQPVEVKAKPLIYEDFNYELISNGTVAAMQRAELRFQSQEIIRRIYVKNGSRVTKGQKIAELDRFKLQVALNQSEEALERSRLDLQDVLIGQGYAIGDSLHIPTDVMRIAKIRSNYEQNLNHYVVAVYNLEASALYAPFDGVVANLTVKEFNQPGSDPFCVLIDNRHPEVIFHILESELPLTQLNDKVIVSPFSMDAFSVAGRITEINPLIDINGLVRVKAVIENKDNRFYEGMNVKVRVQRLLGKQIVIPKSALLLRTNRKVVFTLKDSRAHWVYVETAQENSDNYVVTEGLQAGDSVIYEGNINLAHETPVRVKN
ncbi:MAG: efflux RND transporter periplasmic adaptor subunit [Prevotellaceae bacterium]|jgi:RND family efflux transporter MFP subunit|nr:efflux RND transporter periplasmic adaptor subunit [Prevotellaceae bacterium]